MKPSGPVGHPNCFGQLLLRHPGIEMELTDLLAVDAGIALVPVAANGLRFRGPIGTPIPRHGLTHRTPKRLLAVFLELSNVDG